MITIASTSIYRNSLSGFCNWVVSKSPLATTSNNVVSIDGGNLTIIPGFISSSGVPNLTVAYNGTSTGYSLGYTSNSYTVWICASDTFFFLTARSNAQCGIVYEKVGDEIITNLAGATSSTSFTSVSLVDVATGNPYNHGTILNYTSNLGCIDYTPEFLTSEGIITSLKDTNLFACSTMTADQTITVNRKNYYVLTNHLLIPVGDDEEQT